MCEYSSFVGNFVFRSCGYPDMCLASIEIGRRTYEYYHQYIANDFAKTKNILFPNVEDFREQIERTMEVFNLKDSEIDLRKIYYALKADPKMMYRVPLSACQTVVSKLLSNRIYAKKISFKKNPRFILLFYNQTILVSIIPQAMLVLSTPLLNHVFLFEFSPRHVNCFSAHLHSRFLTMLLIYRAEYEPLKHQHKTEAHYRRKRYLYLHPPELLRQLQVL